METTRFDYVIVVDKNLKTSKSLEWVAKFFYHLQERGIKIDLDYGNITENAYIKLHIPEKVVQALAVVYDIPVKSFGYIPTSSINLKLFQTPYRDASGSDTATNAERILILHEVLNETRFGGDNEYGVQKLLRLGAIKAAYPLHDGPYQMDNDRQLLLKHWANFSLWYKEQPLNLIEKYFGTEVAFYFAWLGFYNKMLIPAAVVGTICFLLSVARVSVHHQILHEICHSNLTMCPRCSFRRHCHTEPLKNQCFSASISVFFDTSLTVFFAVFMSFWATAFLNLWTREENILKVRWNVSNVPAKTSTRLPFKEQSVTSRICSFTGQREAYTPAKVQIYLLALSYGTCFLLMGVVYLAVLGVITYRVIVGSLIRMSDVQVLKTNITFIETCTGALIQVIFIKIYGRYYAPLSEWLTNLENPRSQAEFDNSVVYKRYFLGFINNYTALFYIAFFKGRFYSPSNPPSLLDLKGDMCNVCGCIMTVCIQLFVLMLVKSMLGNILTLVVPMITRRFRRKIQPPETPEWEKQFELSPAGRYLLTTEFMEMIIQYGFVTFFVAAFPLAPLCALVNNCMELRLDAYKLVTRHRRPVPKRHSGILAWNKILKRVTHLSIATNAFVMAFTSDFVARKIYMYRHGNLIGYVYLTLSIYAMNDTPKYGDLDVLTSNTTFCYYRASRYPPHHLRKYQTTPDYWFEIGMKLLCVIIFEHFIMMVHGLFAFFISDTPQKVKEVVSQTKKIESSPKLGDSIAVSPKLKIRRRNEA